MSLEDDVKKSKSNYGAAPNPLGAFLNAEDRTADDIADNPGFFLSSSHCNKIADVKAIINNTFGPHIDIYENARTNRGNPFTGVKFKPTRWPSSRSVSQRNFWKPLENLGYTKNEIKLTKTGYIIRIY